MGFTTCYAADGTVRTIQYDHNANASVEAPAGWQRPAGEARATQAPRTGAYWPPDDDFADDFIDGFAEAAPGRRGFLGRAGRATLGLAAATSCFTAVQGLTSRGFASVPVDAGLAAAPVPERIAKPPTLVPVNDADRREWAAFRERFVADDGRVVDSGNNGVSHTEGQGWGLLFAVAFDDADSFARILSWTRRNLARPADALHAWRFVPGRARPVDDLNNATDGDVFIAWALWRAAYRWGRPDYAIAARAIARDVLRLLVRSAGERTVLLPAAFGFDHGANIDLNPSYYCFPAFRDLAEACPSPLWGRLHDDGLSLILDGRFGHWRLPPDWLSVARIDGTLTPAAGWPARFSYDAIRVPLYLYWARLLQPQVYESFSRFWRDTNPLPAWVDLRSGNLASYPAPAGIMAVAKIATAPSKTALPHDFPTIRASTDYYSAALILLARLAWQERLYV